MGVGLGIDGEKIGNLNVDNMKESKKEEDEIEVSAGCWINFRFLGRCISARSKVDSSICGGTTPS
ncbi:hypothetical protein Tco_1104763, partial [Tanacetum coccineum]